MVGSGVFPFDGEGSTGATLVAAAGPEEPISVVWRWRFKSFDGGGVSRLANIESQSWDVLVFDCCGCCC